MAERQYVVFELGKEDFGIDIMKVKEIIPYEDPTHIPNSPSFIEGVLNYRDKVIPIVNLKNRFKVEDDENSNNKEKRIIIINLNNKEIGFIVDQASQTIRMDEKDIDPAPDVILEVNKRFITGVGKIDKSRLLIILNLHNVLTDDEMIEVTEMEVEV